MLSTRLELSFGEYENFFRFGLPTDGSLYATQQHEVGRYRLAGIERHQRIYETVTTEPATAQGIELPEQRVAEKRIENHHQK